MRRVMQRIIIFGILGAVVTVGVAWGVVVSRERYRGFSPSLDIGWLRASSAAGQEQRLHDAYGRSNEDAFGAWWHVQVLLSDAQERTTLPDLQRETPSWVIDFLSAERLDELREESTWHYMEASGWPMLALCGGCVMDMKGRLSQVSSTEWAIIPPWAVAPGQPLTGREFKFLPLRPIWPGFLVNSALAGILLWALWTLPGVLRRTIRRRRGLCLRCGYDLRGRADAPCPECGSGAVSVVGRVAGLSPAPHSFSRPSWRYFSRYFSLRRFWRLPRSMVRPSM